jgi:hypothetical protein
MKAPGKIEFVTILNVILGCAANAGNFTETDKKAI